MKKKVETKGRGDIETGENHIIFLKGEVGWKLEISKLYVIIKIRIT